MNSITASINGMGNIVANSKNFKTGSTGYYGSGKLTGKDGKRYQANVQLVEIGSKNRETTKEPDIEVVEDVIPV